MHLKKLVISVFLLILIFSINSCNIPGLNINTDEEEIITISGYVGINNFFSSGTTLKSIIPTKERNLNRWKIAIKNTSTFVEKTIKPDYNSGSKRLNFSTELEKIPGSNLQLHAYYDFDNNLVYDSPKDKIFTLTIISGEKNNKSIRIEDVFIYTGTIAPDTDTTADWVTNTQLLSKIYNTTHYISHYQLLEKPDNNNDSAYTFYIAKNNSVNIDVGPKNDNFSDYAAQIYGGEYVYQDVTGSSFTINKIDIFIDIDDDATNPVFSGYPLYLMVGASDWNAQIIQVKDSITVSTYSKHLYRRSGATLYCWAFVDKNFNGVHQKDEPINPALTNSGEYIKNDGSGDNISNINLAVDRQTFEISSQ